MTDEERKLRHLMLEKLGGSPTDTDGRSVRFREDIMDRRLVVTDFEGAYGKAGTAIVLEGSPPRGVIVCIDPQFTHWPAPIFYLDTRGSRRLGEAQARTVKEYLLSLDKEKE